MISTIGGLFNLNHFDQGSRANDVIVIRHRDGTLHSSPFNVRFGRAKIWNSLNKVVQVEVNGVLTNAVMKIGKGGEAYWLQPTYGAFQHRHQQRQQQQAAAGAAAASTAATNTTATTQQLSLSGDALLSPDTTALPLLQARRDGTLGIDRDAIHSAGDAQQAQLALEAVAAAEKSRRRLRSFITDDAFLMEAARKEGEATEQAMAMRMHSAAGAAAQTSSTFANDAPPDAGETQIPMDQQPPEAATAVIATAGAGAPRDGSDSDDNASDALMYGEDDDAYFLDPIDADEFEGHDVSTGGGVAGGLNLDDPNLPNYSFSSSVTSGVSINDVPPITSATAVTRASPSPRGGGGSSAMPTPAKPPPQQRQVTWGPTAGDEAGLATATTTIFGGDGVETPEAHQPRTPPRRSLANSNSNSHSADAVATDYNDDDDDDLGLDGDDVDDGAGGGASPGVTASPATTTAATAAPSAPAQTNYFTRTLIPTAEDLQKLNLVDGCNTVRYLARKSHDEVVAVACNIFLWDAMDRLVVSDVDGTITKSDLWGHVYLALGKGGDWTHPGICSLYSKVVANGYKMVYLTARSVAQIDQTKKYLLTLEQEDGLKLPLGPVLTAPQRFFTALTQEVSKQSHVFKIACLTGVKAAFPPSARPFFAGFGNRYNDLISYDAVGIPIHKIFIIDPTSVLHVCQVKQTYRNLAHLVDVTFPRIHKRRHRKLRGGERYGDGDGDKYTANGNNSNNPQSGRSDDGGSVYSSDVEGSDGDDFYRVLGDSPRGNRLDNNTNSNDGRGGSGHGLVETKSAMFSLAEGGLPTDASWSGLASSANSTTGAGAGGGGMGLRRVSDPATTAALSSTGSFSATRPNTAAPATVTAAAGNTTTTTTTKRGGPTPPAPPPQRHNNMTPGHHHDHSDNGEDVMPDPEFSSYSYWRVDPRDLITPAPAAKATPSGGGGGGGATSKAPIASSATLQTKAKAAATATAIATTTGSSTISISCGGGKAAGGGTGLTISTGADKTLSSLSSPLVTATTTTGATAAAAKAATTPEATATATAVTVAAASPVGGTPGSSTTSTSATAVPSPSEKRGFFSSFAFSRGKAPKTGSSADGSPVGGGGPAKTPPSYSHPHYQTYTMGIEGAHSAAAAAAAAAAASAAAVSTPGPASPKSGRDGGTPSLSSLPESPTAIAGAAAAAAAKLAGKP